MSTSDVPGFIFFTQQYTPSNKAFNVHDAESTPDATINFYKFFYSAIKFRTFNQILIHEPKQQFNVLSRF